MLSKIEEAIDRINYLKNKKIKLISHYDSDGITSAAIFSRALQREGINFTLKIVKSLDSEFIKNLSEEEVLIFLDLGSSSLEHFKKKNNEIFVFDHHEIQGDIPNNVFMINSRFFEKESLFNFSASAICYLFAKKLSHKNKDLASLAVVGMIGDQQYPEDNKLYNEILRDAEALVKRSLLLYPATRPLDKSLEYSSHFFIPGITGSFKGVHEFLNNTGIKKENGKYKSVYELDENEVDLLINAIESRGVDKSQLANFVGNLYLLKIFDKIEDAREFSALINACGRMGHSEIALGFCLKNKLYKEKAEEFHINYRQSLISALKFVADNDKIEGNNYIIINAKDNISDTLIGTVASIVSYSSYCNKGDVIIALAYCGNKIKVSLRRAGKQGKNVREILIKSMESFEGECGGHPCAAGGFFDKSYEEKFIENLKNILEVELVKV